MQSTKYTDGAADKGDALVADLTSGTPKMNGIDALTANSATGTDQHNLGKNLTSHLRKTKFCVYHLKGSCQYGTHCAFAHSCNELESPPDLSKTRLCQDFEQGSCKNPKCSFAHGREELRSTPMFFKKSLCIWNEKGKCRNGERCCFAHGKAELLRNKQRLPVAPLRVAIKAEQSAAANDSDSPTDIADAHSQPMKVLQAAHLAAPEIKLSQLIPDAMPRAGTEPDAMPSNWFETPWWPWYPYGAVMPATLDHEKGYATPA